MRDVLLKILLFPFSLLYGFGAGIHDLLYRVGLLRGVRFDVPVISVGNLSVGGSGKTPHTEYLVRLLQDYINLGILSRGYKRKTSGFRFVQPADTAETVGDEPLQYKRKFPDVVVAVGESRALAIPQLLMSDMELHAVLLDDAYQHRAVLPGLNILLTEYSRPFTRDFLLPMGRLREWRSAYERADIIVLTKCPVRLGEAERAAWRKEIAPLPHQKLFFSYYKYGQAYFLFNPQLRLPLQREWNVLLLCAIANVDYLMEYAERQVQRVQLLEYPDHHNFTKYEISRLVSRYQQWDVTDKVIVTTEKDAVRLELHAAYLREKNIPILVLPVEVAFHEAGFDEAVKQFLLDFRA
jgi:tetraacyldisaccharide 4'-kinase